MNMTMVNIESYTDGDLEPGNANLFGTNYELEVFSPGSVMNLVSNSTLLLLKKVSQGKFTEPELAALSSTDSNIVIHRSNLRMNRINMYRNVDTDYLVPTNFLRAIYLQEKNVTILNSEVRVTGFILHTNDPMSLFVQNMLVDFHASMAGFYLKIECNYPEAYNDGTVKIDNVTAINGKEKKATLTKGLLYHSGAEDFIAINSYFGIYGLYEEESSPLERNSLET